MSKDKDPHTCGIRSEVTPAGGIRGSSMFGERREAEGHRDMHDNHGKCSKALKRHVCAAREGNGEARVEPPSCSMCVFS